MGPAHCTIMNHTTEKLCVITFNNADIIYNNYNTLYVIDPGQPALVEANPDPTGLKVGIVYAVNPDKNEFLYHRFLCKNDGTLNVTEVRGDDISYYGNRDEAVLQAKGKIKEREQVPFEMVRSIVYNIPSNISTKDGDRGQKLPSAITNAAKTISTGIQSSINQAQNQLTNIGGQATKALGINSEVKNRTSDENQSEDPRKPEASYNPYKLDENNSTNSAITSSKPVSNIEKSPEISAADKWEAELKRLKEETKKYSQNPKPSSPPTPPPIPTPPDLKPIVPKDMQRLDSLQQSNPSVDGFLIPQPRAKRTVPDISTPSIESKPTPSDKSRSLEKPSMATSQYSRHSENIPRNPFLQTEEFPPLPLPSQRENSTDTEVSSANGQKQNAAEITEKQSEEKKMVPTEMDGHVVPESHNGCKCVVQ